MAIGSCRWLCILTRLDKKAEPPPALCCSTSTPPLALPEARACNRQGREDNVPVLSLPFLLQPLPVVWRRTYATATAVAAAPLV
jgi:hypothetical protein